MLKICKFTNCKFKEKVKCINKPYAVECSLLAEIALIGDAFLRLNDFKTTINKSIATWAECPITMDEVAQVQNSIKSSVSNEDIERLLEFKEQYR